MMNSPSDFKTKVNQINVPEEKLNHAIDIAIKKGRRKRLRVGKKIAYICCAAILLFALLLSSAFVSPAIAKVVSKIPYLSLIFESKPVVVIIMENLEEKGYKNIGIGISYVPKKNIQITVEGSAKYYNEVKEGHQ
ncbi:DUF4179 domain-containing protein [Terrilactibacillus laevilacticus]|uniref:DUF4179 domain-containing protein n=1 Tax=Terrilactibacillus laevilacticus TaxID=1380157 RepID=UPI00114776E4|nr:DUF4179 domain-containing protein [Terrilactibacillus laevilacticus]